MLFIVNGTGPWGESYESDMATSFCKQIEKLGGGKYFRGPTTFGLQTYLISDAIVTGIKEKMAKGDSSPVFLVGHSRGGAAVIRAAQLLKTERIDVKVKAMFLFDAVDRTLNRSVNVQMVPGNVVTCYHAMRDRKFREHLGNDVAKALADWNSNSKIAPASPATRLKGTAYSDLCHKDMMFRRFSRCENITEFEYYSLDFGNCGLSAEAPCKMVPHDLFYCTHGAVGGAPEPEAKHKVRELAEEDNKAQDKVRTWIFKSMLQEGALQPGGM